MTVSTIYATADDATLYRSGGSWAAAYASTSISTYQNVYVGWEVGSLDDGVIIFDTSAIPDTDVVSATVLSIALSSDNTTSGFTIEARRTDAGPTLDTGDWIAPASLSGTTLVASVATASVAGTGYTDLTSEAAFPGEVNKTGYTGVYLNADFERTNTDPGAAEYMVFDDGNNTNPPYLTITHAAPAGPTMPVFDHYYRQRRA